MDNLKILFINHSSKISGAEIVLLNLLDLLRKNNVVPLFICPPGGDLIKRLKKDRIRTEIIPMPVLSRTFNPLKLFYFFINFLLHLQKFKKIIRENKIDIIHANSFRAAFWIMLAARITDTPLIWHMHDIVKKRFFNQFFIKLTASRCFKIICVSKAVKRNLVNLGVDESKCVVIYNGIDRKKFISKKVAANKFRKEFNINNNIPLVGMIGQIARWKGQKIFLEAILKIIVNLPQTKFLIIGDVINEKEKEYKKELKKFIQERKINKNVIFTGFREDISQVITDLDIIVHASINPDPLPTVIIESMALGKPVVASNVGGVPELITNRKSGFLVFPSAPNELAKAVIELIGNKKLAKKIGLEGQKEIDRKFNIEENLRKILKIYNLKYVKKR